MLVTLEKIFDKFSLIIGYIAGVLMIIMIFNVAYDVIMRYFFNNVSIGMQELEWHLFGAVFLLGLSYTLREDGHVRVDMFYERLSVKKRSLINIVGALIFILPLSILIVIDGYNYAYEAYTLGEQSDDPGGLPYRFLVKGLIGFSFLLLIISTIGFMLHNINRFLGNEDYPEHDHASDLV